MNVDECDVTAMAAAGTPLLTKQKETLSCGYLVVVSKTTQESEHRNSVIVPAA